MDEMNLTRNEKEEKYQLRVLEKRNSYPQVGDVFELSPEEGRFLNGIVVNNHVNSVRGDDLLVVLIFKEGINIRDEAEKGIDGRHLLIPPQIVEQRFWTEGYFYTIDMLSQGSFGLCYGFYDFQNGEHLNEYGKVISQEIEPELRGYFGVLTEEGLSRKLGQILDAGNTEKKADCTYSNVWDTPFVEQEAEVQEIPDGEHVRETNIHMHKMSYADSQKYYQYKYKKRRKEFQIDRVLMEIGCVSAVVVLLVAGSEMDTIYMRLGFGASIIFTALIPIIMSRFFLRKNQWYEKAQGTLCEQGIAEASYRDMVTLIREDGTELEYKMKFDDDMKLKDGEDSVILYIPAANQIFMEKKEIFDKIFAVQ